MDGPRDYHTKWSKPHRERQLSYDIAYMWNLKKKNDTNELTHKTEIDPRTEKTNLWLPKGKGGWKSEKFRINIYTLLYIK